MTNRLIAIVLAVVAAAWAAPALAPRAGQAASLAQDKAVWEYAQFRVRALGVTDYYGLELGEKTVADFETLEKFEVKLGIKVRRTEGKASRSVVEIVVLNHLGSQGWELVSHARVTDTHQIYTFKRKR